MEAYLSVERGYDSEYGLGLLALVAGAGVITLGAAGIATGLAQADARADHATLAAVGAAPRLRRTLAAAQALSISGLGTALGVAAGFVPAVALIAALPGLDLVDPLVAARPGHGRRAVDRGRVRVAAHPVAGPAGAEGGVSPADLRRERLAARRRIRQVLTERRLVMIDVAPTHQTRRQSGVSAQRVGARLVQASMVSTGRIPTDS